MPSPTDHPDAGDFQQHMQRLDTLLDEADTAADPACKTRLQELAAGLLELHGHALARLVDLIASAENGGPLLDALARDDAVGPLLVLHNLHPLDLPGRIRLAVEKATPHLPRGASLELLSIADAAVHLRIDNAGHACHGTLSSLQDTIEQHFHALVPECASIRIDGLEEPASDAGFVPLDRLAINGGLAHAAAT